MSLIEIRKVLRLHYKELRGRRRVSVSNSAKLRTSYLQPKRKL